VALPQAIIRQRVRMSCDSDYQVNLVKGKEENKKFVEVSKAEEKGVKGREVIPKRQDVMWQ
jgi:hypothetical protein